MHARVERGGVDGSAPDQDEKGKENETVNQAGIEITPDGKLQDAVSEKILDALPSVAIPDFGLPHGLPEIETLIEAPAADGQGNDREDIKGDLIIRGIPEYLPPLVAGTEYQVFHMSRPPFHCSVVKPLGSGLPGQEGAGQDCAPSRAFRALRPVPVLYLSLSPLLSSRSAPPGGRLTSSDSSLRPPAEAVTAPLFALSVRRGTNVCGALPSGCIRWRWLYRAQEGNLRKRRRRFVRPGRENFPSKS